MKSFSGLAGAVVLSLAAMAAPVAASAGSAGAAGTPAHSVLDVLAGTAVPPAQLGAERARGVFIGSASNDAAMIDNTVGPGSHTGTITNNSSINNNTGVTTVFQNTGNNSIIQNSTAIYITVH